MVEVGIVGDIEYSGLTVGDEIEMTLLGADSLVGVMTGSLEARVEGLRQWLGYPVKERDPQGSRFWYVRPGEDEGASEDVCPVAVGFYEELGRLQAGDIRGFLTGDEQQREIYGHFLGRMIPDQPVMYVLLPEQERQGYVALVLPTEGGLRHRQVEVLGWDSEELVGRLSRLRWGALPLAERAMATIPLVDWVFFPAARTAAELAKLLAEATRRMEQGIPKVFETEGTEGYLHQLFESFRRELLPTLKLVGDGDKDYSFADIYAQTIAYGLFTARVFGYVRDPKGDFNRQGAWDLVPETNPFLRELFRDVSERSAEELGSDLMEGITEIFGILRAAKMDAVLSDFRQKLNREDIVIRFYEDFLAAYKPQMRERRGVYYTPEPVVSYVVRSVDALVREKFGKPLGLADPSVVMLDPACGTGTFLLALVQLVRGRFEEEKEVIREITEVPDLEWSGYVQQFLLPRVYGFELLMAPYAVAHLKLGLFLAESGYGFEGGQRLNVFLMNTLDDLSRDLDGDQLALDIPQMEQVIATEAAKGLRTRDQEPVMIVIGNPPYSGHSANSGEWIGGILRDYYQVDGQPLGEKNPKWLQDDYVKFIRFGQWRIQQTGHGILAFVTNHGYLDNPTFRGMRQSLQGTFDWIRVLDLHGNSKKKEKAPDGSKDENVFDIQQGVSICLMVKEVQKD